MIYMSFKNIYKRMFLTLFKRNLYFVGVFEFWVREKKIIKLHSQEIPSYWLYLSTIDNKYSDTLVVKPKEYDKYHLNKCFGKCGVVSHKHKEGYYIVTKNTEAKAAIKEATGFSKIQFIFLVIICILVVISLLIMIKRIRSVN